MSEFIKRQKFATRGHNVLWFFECPDCGATFVSSNEDVLRKKPCGNSAKSFYDKIRFVLSELKSRDVSYNKICSAINVNPASISGFLRNHNETKNTYWVNRLGSIGINLEFIYGYSCEPFKTRIDFIVEYLNSIENIKFSNNEWHKNNPDYTREFQKGYYSQPEIKAKYKKRQHQYYLNRKLKKTNSSPSGSPVVTEANLNKEQKCQ